MKIRAVLFAIGGLAAALPLLASAAPATVEAGLVHCRAIGDAAARLACYDALAAAPAEAASAPAAAGFGFENRLPRSAPEAIESRIPGYFEGWGPKSQIRLANGQVWQVIDDSRGVVERRDPKVKVTRATLGTFFLEIEGHNQAPRVRRVD